MGNLRQTIKAWPNRRPLSITRRLASIMIALSHPSTSLKLAKGYLTADSAGMISLRLLSPRLATSCIHCLRNKRDITLEGSTLFFSDSCSRGQVLLVLTNLRSSSWSLLIMAHIYTDILMSSQTRLSSQAEYYSQISRASCPFVFKWPIVGLLTGQHRC